MGVSKAVLGDPSIATAMIEGGVSSIADSRIENIARMKAASIDVEFVLLRSVLSQAQATVRLADISLNTELNTIRALSKCAAEQQKQHRVIIMVELGDLREGVRPQDLIEFVRSTVVLPNIKLSGLGANLACLGGVSPDDKNMRELSELVAIIECEIGSSLDIVSGGNSANHNWCDETNSIGRINSLRLGESILLGKETLAGKAIDGLGQTAFQLVAEVIESKVKPSKPYGKICRNAFGEVPNFENFGEMPRAILALGRQDVHVPSISPARDYAIVGSSSDHVILDTKGSSVSVGDEVRFDLNYAALLSAMSSRFVAKAYQA